MSKKSIAITQQNGCFILEGELDFSNMMAIYQQCLSELNKAPELKFDFAKLTSSNSAGLALIIEWIKFSRKSNKPLQLKHVPADLLTIAKIAGLDALINHPAI